MPKSVTFYSEGVKLAGDLLLPTDIKPGGRRAGIVLCHGYTGVRSIYLPDNARVIAEAGYVVLNFDYKGWGDSDGAKTRLAPYSRVADVQAGPWDCLGHHLSCARVPARVRPNSHQHQGDNDEQ